MPVEDQLVDKWKASEGRSLLDIATKGKYKKSKDIPPLKRKDLHTILATAGMTPTLGNIADAADALLYIAEGEFGSAGLSAAAMVPIAGQFVSAKRALKAAKKSGEEMVTLYRGVDKWYPARKTKIEYYEGRHGYEYIVPTRNTMVDQKTGNFIGKGGGIWTSADKKYAKTFTDEAFGKPKGRWAQRMGAKYVHTDSRLLEFEVPKSYINKFGYIKKEGGAKTRFAKEVQEYTQKHYGNLFFDKGIPKEFLKKVHK